MATFDLMKPVSIPSLFEDFYRPWHELFDTTGGRIWQRVATIPPVNVTENEGGYRLSLAAPGLKKEDFRIDVKENVLTISCEKEEDAEVKEGEMTRKEFSYTSFTRNFNLPENVRFEAIEAKYMDGVLELMLPKKEEFRKATAMKHIAVK